MRCWWLAFFLSSWLQGASESALWVSLDPEGLPAQWQLIIDAQQAKEFVRAEFIEERFNRLRRRPSLYEGNILYSKRDGLSLHYQAAISSIVVLDEGGIVRRSIEGERHLPMSDEAGGLPQLILQLFALDLVALKERFEMEGQLRDDDWALRFLPEETMVESLGVRSVMLEGSADWVREIRFNRTGGMRLKIRLSEHAMMEELTEAMRKERFR